jgi:DNA-binding response OmpR family regulator
MTTKRIAVTENATVLVVDDEADLTDLYADYLDAEYDVRRAYGGEEALDEMNEAIDVVLLDRRMPVTSGDEVLAAIEERGYDCQVAMVTAVDPDFDILDLGCDDYVVKPVSKDALNEIVERMLKIDEYNERFQELTAKKLKRNLLEVEKTSRELEQSEVFEALQDDIRSLQAEIEDIADDIGSDALKRHL